MEVVYVGCLPIEVDTADQEVSCKRPLLQFKPVPVSIHLSV